MGVFLSPELTSLKILTIFYGASLCLCSSRNLYFEYLGIQLSILNFCELFLQSTALLRKVRKLRYCLQTSFWLVEFFITLNIFLVDTEEALHEILLYFPPTKIAGVLQEDLSIGKCLSHPQNQCQENILVCLFLFGLECNS